MSINEHYSCRCNTFSDSRRMSRLLTLLLLWVAGNQVWADGLEGQHTREITSDMIVQVSPWGGAGHVVAADSMYFASQPDAAGYAAAAAAGVTTVINIRGPQEVDWDIAAAVKQAGMAYYNEPLGLGKQGIDEASVERINALVDSAADGKVLVHCASGNRVAVWWAIHLARQHGMSVDSAIAMAQQAGMKPALGKMVRAYFNGHDASR